MVSGEKDTLQGQASKDVIFVILCIRVLNTSQVKNTWIDGSHLI